MKILAALTSLFAPMEPVLSSDGVSARFARMLTDRNNPDHIILAAITQSFATEFDKWTAHWSEFGYHHNNGRRFAPERVHPGPFKVNSNGYADSSPTITFSVLKSPRFVVHIQSKLLQSVTKDSTAWKLRLREVIDFTVNGVPLANELAEGLLFAFCDVRDKHETAKAVAEKAKAEMEANEKKWEVVESVLGMTRNADGALIPAE